MKVSKTFKAWVAIVFAMLIAYLLWSIQATIVLETLKILYAGAVVLCAICLWSVLKWLKNDE